MPPPPVVVVRPFLSKLILSLALALAGAVPLAASAQQDSSASHYLAEIVLHTEEEFFGVLQRAEQLLLQGEVDQSGQPQVAFVLHGPEVHLLLKQNYSKHREVVDLAARLSALGVVDIKACRTWMGSNGIDEEQLQPFVSTVPFALAETRRLVEEEGYIYF